MSAFLFQSPPQAVARINDKARHANRYQPTPDKAVQRSRKARGIEQNSEWKAGCAGVRA